MSLEDLKRALSGIQDAFDDAKSMIGAGSVAWRLVPNELLAITQKFDDGEVVSDIELAKVRKTWISREPFIDAQGRVFVLYIPDFTVRWYHSGSALPKFHLSWCSTLERMESEGRRARYIKKSDVDNNDFKGKRANQDVVESLQACFDCRNKMRRKVAPKQLYFERNDMDIRKFFDLHSPQQLKDASAIPYETEYSSNWTEISRRTKASRGSRCEECSSGSSLETHHINGRRDQNHSANLRVLCHSCHARQPMHGHMR